MDEYEQAWDDYRKDFIKKQNEIITKLKTIKENTISQVYQKWLDQAIQFIYDQKG